MSLPIITGELTLRPFTAADAPEVERLAGDFAIADTTLNVPHPYAAGSAAGWIATHAAQHAEGRALTLAVADTSNDTLLACVGLAITPAHQRAELGYWVGRPYWGRGIATRASRALIAHGFMVLGLQRITVCHFARNPASGHVIAKCGFRHEGTLRQQYRCRFRKGFEDVELYGLLRGEWEQTR